MSGMHWESSRVVKVSQSRPGVEFVIARMTFGRRLELMTRVRDLAARLEYFEAGREERQNAWRRAYSRAEIDRLYVRWGLEEVRGLEIDGAPADVDALIDRGPEDLFLEALSAIRAECGLSGSRKKKLIVAFHFQFANRAGWNCDECRKHGLEKKRRCGFIAEEKRGNPFVVWGRKRARTEECPKSFITGQSLAWIEEFVARRRLSVPDSLERGRAQGGRIPDSAERNGDRNTRWPNVALKRRSRQLRLPVCGECRIRATISWSFHGRTGDVEVCPMSRSDE